MVAGSLRQLVFISATPPTPGVCGKDDTLLFGVKRGQFLCSGQQTEHKRHTELHSQAVHGWKTLVASSHWLFLQKDRKKKEIFPPMEKKNLSEEHAAEQALTSPAPHMVGRAAWHRASPCSPGGIVIAEGYPANAPGYQDSRKGKMVQSWGLITLLCCAWCRRGGILHSTKLPGQAA